MAYSLLPVSSFLDLTGYKVTTKTAVPDAYQLSPSQWHQIEGQLPVKLHVAIVLNRANSPSELLSKSWGYRFSELQKLNSKQSLWTTYGAIPSDYLVALSVLRDELGLRILDLNNSTYNSSPESRTIWVELSMAEDFHKHF